MPTPPIERAKMDWIPWALDILGVPQLDELLPVPADVFTRLNIPLPRDVILDLKRDFENRLNEIDRKMRSRR